jgi:hypothetical protein
VIERLSEWLGVPLLATRSREDLESLAKRGFPSRSPLPSFFLLFSYHPTPGSTIGIYSCFII